LEIFSNLKRKLSTIQTWKQKQSNYKNSTIVKKTLMFKVAPEATTRTKKRMRDTVTVVKRFNVLNSEIDRYL